jgi:hypothetical protein
MPHMFCAPFGSPPTPRPRDVPPWQAAASAGVSMVDAGDGLSVPAHLMVAVQLQGYDVHPKQVAWVLNVSSGTHTWTVDCC